MISSIDSNLASIGTPQCQKWSAEIFNKHLPSKKALQKKYVERANKNGYVDANQWLFNAARLVAICARHSTIDGYLKKHYERVQRSFGHARAIEVLEQLDERLCFGGGLAHNGSVIKQRFSAAMDLEELCEMADTHAQRFERRWQQINQNQDLWDAYASLVRYLACVGINNPVDLKDDETEEEMHAKIIAGAARVCCNLWWRRQLKTKCVRMVENVLRSIGQVTKSKHTPYVSKWGLGRYLLCQKRNETILANMEMENQEGVVKPLADAIAQSQANPVNRRNEFMVRSRGYEEIAKALNLTPLFLTLTCPSKYHARLHTGAENTKFNGADPREANDYLSCVWSRIRAKWKRKGIKAFGFRVAEPHHDGTPHYHFLLYINPDQVALAKAIFGAYALQEDGSEAGADKHRWDCVEVDYARGSATGYISKYIAKNIDGAHVDWDKDTAAGSDDYTGVTGEEGAARVKAWSSFWGIRQFQQIGCVSVTVWREVRSAIDQLADQESEEVQSVIEAAGDSDWAAFVEAMGGAFVGRDDQTLRPRMEEIEGAPSRYDEPVKKLLGFWIKGAARHLPVKKDIWRIRDAEERKAEFPVFDIKKVAQSDHAWWLFKRAASPPVSDLYQ